MNALTHAAKALTLSLTLVLATVTLACGCAVGTDSTDEPGTVDGETVGETQQEIKGTISPNCGYCYYWDNKLLQCVHSDLSVCAIEGNG
jgi:hypothetical protein